MTEFRKIWGPFYDRTGADIDVNLNLRVKFYFIGIGMDHNMRHLTLSYASKERKFSAHVERSGRRVKGQGPSPDALLALVKDDPPGPIPGLLVDALRSMISDADKAACTAASIQGEWKLR